jgi:hypothetical protein
VHPLYSSPHLNGYLPYLDSDFNLPADVTIEFAVNSKKNVNLQPLQAANNPQVGGLAPEAFKDKNLDTTPDPAAVSGYASNSVWSKLMFRPLFTLADGSVVC